MGSFVHEGGRGVTAPGTARESEEVVAVGVEAEATVLEDLDLAAGGIWEADGLRQGEE